MAQCDELQCAVYRFCFLFLFPNIVINVYRVNYLSHSKRVFQNLSAMYYNNNNNNNCQRHVSLVAVA